MSTVNLYDVLDVSQDCTTKDIKNAYKKLVLEFHPDRMGGDDEMFELITHAYNILVNPESRSEYDEIYALSKQSDASHSDFKNQSKTFYEALENDTKLKKKSKEDYEKEFKKSFEDMDRKHGYNRDQNEKNLTEKTTTQRLRDLELAREQDDIEHTHEKLFDEKMPFDLSKFNRAFDEMHKSHSELIPHQGNPMAWNLGNDFASVYSSVNDYEKLYTGDDDDDDADDDNDAGDDIGTSMYGSLKLNLNLNLNNDKKKLTKEDLEKISNADYTDGHNYKDGDYTKSLSEKLKERDIQTREFDKRNIQDFDTELGCGGYGIFEQVNVKNIGNLTWDVDDKEDLKTRYQRLLEMRKNF